MLLRELDLQQQGWVLMPCVCMQLTGDDYELPTLRPKILAWGREVSLGRGFQLLRCNARLPAAELQASCQQHLRQLLGMLTSC